MCGICGAYGLETGFEVDPIKEMLVATQSRGKDATGYAATVDMGLKIDKADVPALQFVTQTARDSDLHIDRATSWIGHCRLATHGGPENNENNHPFTKRGLALVHNGMIYNYRQFEHDDRFKLESECDSEVILQLIAYYRRQGHRTSEAIQLAATELDGAMACALINRKGDMWLWRRDEHQYAFTPLSVAYRTDKPELHFASTRDILKKSVTQNNWLTYTFESNEGFLLRRTPTGYTTDPFEIPSCDDKKLKWGSYSSYYDGMHSYDPNDWDDDDSLSGVRSWSKEKGWHTLDVTAGSARAASSPMGPLLQITDRYSDGTQRIRIKTLGEINTMGNLEDVYHCEDCSEYLFFYEVVLHYDRLGHKNYMKEDWGDV